MLKLHKDIVQIFVKDEKKITRAIDLYFGGAMSFEKMFDTIDVIGCLEK